MNAQSAAAHKISASSDAATPAGATVSAQALLAANEPSAVTIERADGTADFVLVCDHASRELPRSLGTLGLSHTELASHIAWDIGASGVARLLSERLDATLLMQNYSRLVIDCNRPLAAPDSIATRSEWVEITGNEQLSEEQIRLRRDSIFTPYHDAVRATLDARRTAGRKTLLVSMHSFTPKYLNTSRPWSIGVMYRHDARLGSELLTLLKRDKRMEVGDNQPYAIEDESDYTLPVHGETRGIAHVGIEIRQDLIADEVGQKTWAGRLASLLKQAAGAMNG